MKDNEKMRFGSLLWQINPDTVKTERARDFTYKENSGKVYSFDGGMKTASVICGGCFFENTTRLKLEELMKEGKVLPLYVPGKGITRAKLVKMEYEGRKSFGQEAYRLEFADIGLFSGREDSRGKYTAAYGEDIWDVSRKTNVSVEKLIKLNPHIRYINCIEEGEILWLR